MKKISKFIFYTEGALYYIKNNKRIVIASRRRSNLGQYLYQAQALDKVCPTGLLRCARNDEGVFDSLLKNFMHKLWDNAWEGV